MENRLRLALAAVSLYLGASSLHVKAETVEVPLMGKGDLAILSVSQSQVHLANLKTSSQMNGIVYFDQHIRMADKRLAGDPHQNEFVMRIKIDCHEMRIAILSSISQNFHTGKQAEKAWDFADNPNFEPLREGSDGRKICIAINNGESLYFALGQNHYELLEVFPRYALSYWDAFDIDEIDENGVITQLSKSLLLQYLKEHNPNF
jgi:hypothetical protein